MTRAEYMKILSKKLRRLPKEDYEKAITYFEEYFDEAGAANESQAIEDLGSPSEAANDLIMGLARKNSEKPPKTMRRGFSAIWVGILGICAAPVALPLALAAVAVIFALIFSICAVLLALILSATAVIASGFLCGIGGGILLFQTMSDGLCNLGIGVLSLGVGILFFYGTIFLFKWFLRKTVYVLGKLIKGGHKNEKIN